MTLAEEVRKFFKGDISDDEATLKTYSHDASLFEVKPKLVVFPKDTEDLKNLVKWVGENPGNSVTVRAAGSDMTGGPLGESVVADVTRYLNKMAEISEHKGLTSVLVEPGMFYRDFEQRTQEKGLILPCFTASKNLCALGGMFGNNCAGERSLRYGKMENFILESKVIFADGNEYVVKPLSRTELDVKMAQGDFEGSIYQKIFSLVEDNKEALAQAKPKVSKNSAGYYLWNVWDVEHQVFDINKLLVGSQGTLGIVTEMKLKLVPEKKYHDMVALFLKSWDELPQVVNAILPHDPESLETFDEDTLKLGIRFMPEIARKAGTGLVSFAAQFIPEILIGLRMLGLPKLIILVEIAEQAEGEVKEKVKKVMEALKSFNVWSRVIEKDSEEEKFWVMRRESFNLLRKHVKGKRTAPFVDDFCISAEKVPEFLPRALKILEEAGIEANIAGHAGNGNFHIIPLMDLRKESERKKIPIVADKFYDLVAEYKGTTTAEHNDGIVRTPYLNKMYSPKVLGLFKQTKEIFDPQNIFNPGKKVNGTLEYLESHIAIE
ncbi:MAG: FAD-binding oxidoreductase [bacterium]|nr:FAD-binding oxidoreductase [bacterium]